MSKPQIIDNEMLQRITDLARDFDVNPPVEYSDPEQVSSFSPEACLIGPLIEAVFWASLDEEEGKPVRPRVALSLPQENDCVIAPVALSSQTLRKLSPILDSPSSFILCSKELQLVGIGRLNDRDISVHAERPGTLVVSQMQIVLAILDNGEWFHIQRDTELLSKVMASFFGEENERYRSRKAYHLIRLAMRARATRRGAIFVVTPPQQHSGLASSSAASFAIDSFNAGREALFKGSDVDRSFEWMHNRHAYELHRTNVRNLSDQFEAIVSAGAGIDGATLLDDTDLRPVGFGYKIDAEPFPDTVLLLSFPGTQERVPLKAVGGMRHQSAARLVHRNRAATVVTVSQDGAISIFSWDEEAMCVAAVKHVDRFLRAASPDGVL
jgi:hypothetical protein